MVATVAMRAAVAAPARAVLPARRRGALAVRAATALPAEVSAASRPMHGNVRAMQATGAHPPPPCLPPAGQDRHPRGRPRVCEGRGGGEQDRGRHPAAQLRAEAADAGHRRVGGQRQGRQGGRCPGCPDGLPAHPPAVPHSPAPTLPQAGDKVVYSKYAGTELELQGGNFVLLKVRHRWKLPEQRQRRLSRSQALALGSACVAALCAV